MTPHSNYKHDAQIDINRIPAKCHQIKKRESGGYLVNEEVGLLVSYKDLEATIGLMIYELDVQNA